MKSYKEFIPGNCYSRDHHLVLSNCTTVFPVCTYCLWVQTFKEMFIFTNLFEPIVQYLLNKKAT